MDCKRYNISQLARLTGTSRNLLYNWLRSGYLRPSHYSGTRAKFSYQDFLEAEKKANRYTPIRPYSIIPKNFFKDLL